MFNFVIICIYMNEYNHISPNLNNYNSYCIKIQELFEEMLNPQKIHVKFNKLNVSSDGDIRFCKRLHQSNVPREIKLMNPEMESIIVTLEVSDQLYGRGELQLREEEFDSRYKLFVDNFNKSYPIFFTAIMNSLKNNQVHIPLVEDSGMIREGKNIYYSEEDEIDPDLGLTICDYINLEITQPKKYGYNDIRNIRIDIKYTIYEDNLFEFVLKFNYLIVAKKLIRLQGNKNLNIAKEVPIQTKLIRIKPAFTAYPEIDDDITNIQGNKYDDGAIDLIHTTNNARYVKKNENVSNIPMAFDVEKYKPTLVDVDGVFNQLHNSINGNSQGLSTVKARFQKLADVTKKKGDKIRKNKGGKIRKNKGGKTRKKKGGKRKNKSGKRKKLISSFQSY
jgi:hypothetical protein